MRRLLAAVLLMLAISPLTAPFSVGDPLELFGGATAQIQSKAAPDAPPVHASALTHEISTPLLTTTVLAAAVPLDQTPSRLLNLPLRL